jgi:serine protease inhibitor
MSVRKTIIVISAILVVFTVLLYTTGCCSLVTDLFKKTPKETEANKQSDKMAENVDKGLVSLNTDFALNIFKELSNDDKNANVFISPISISLAMAMVYNGARSQTQQEIAKTLEFKDYMINIYTSCTQKYIYIGNLNGDLFIYIVHPYQ